MLGNKRTRLQRLISLHVSRGIGRRVPLWEAQREGGAQHGARYAEARGLGYVIENELERTPDGEVHSWYILRAVPDGSATNKKPPKPGAAYALFAQDELERCAPPPEYPS